MKTSPSGKLVCTFYDGKQEIKCDTFQHCKYLFFLFVESLSFSNTSLRSVVLKKGNRVIYHFEIAYNKPKY